jgi:hypothetical protein
MDRHEIQIFNENIPRRIKDNLFIGLRLDIRKQSTCGSALNSSTLTLKS